MLRSMLVLVACLATPVAANAQSWDFRVLLDDRPIGEHRFELVEQGQRRVLRSEARFEVRFLFFTAYRYRHVSEETWEGGCLTTLNAETQVNGETKKVSGERRDAGFILEKDGERRVLPPCIMTFAYWNPAFLQQSRLLNPQTGEYLEVNVERLPAEEDRRGYRVTARETDLEVWYSDRDRWVGLESEARGDRMLRYEPT